ncbi:MAG TPA: hypothetical protein VFO82_11275 [Steroidobacteraceae bacterium]|nr:hypothetical protein [Steroidobacteraceae bacterium]
MPGPFGFSRTVKDITIAPDGTVYMAGVFMDAAGKRVTNIAAWDGTDYQLLGNGIDINGSVNGIAVDEAGTVWAVASYFTDMGEARGQLYRWSNGAWRPIGDVFDSEVYDLAIIGGKPLVAGAFTHAGTRNVGHLAQLNGTMWTPVGAGEITGGYVATIAATGTGICVGGTFLVTIGAATVENIACWDGTTWSQLGTGEFGGPPMNIWALAQDPNGRWYAGGDFSFYGSAGGHGLARLGHGDVWHALDGGVGNGFDNFVRRIVFDGNDVIVGGRFDAAGREFVEAHNVARWSLGTGWSQVGGGVANEVGIIVEHERGVHSLAIAADGMLWVGGLFSRAGNVAAMNVMRVASDNTASAVVGPRPTNGVSGMVNALATMADGTLIAGGQFSFAGRTAAERLAAWNGTEWAPIFGGLGGTVIDMKVLSTGAIAVAGTDLQSGDTYLGAVAFYRDNAWQVPGGIPIYGTGLVVYEDARKRIWLGGSLYDESFSEEQLFVFDGGAWSSRGDFVNAGPFGELGGSVRAIAEYAGKLVIAGQFDQVNGDVARHIVTEDAAGGWSELGGITGEGLVWVNTLAVHSRLGLVVGGPFHTIGGAEIRNLAAWNGSQWKDIGGGLTAEGNFVFVTKLLPHGDGLFVAGGFDHAGTTPAQNIAWFDGTSWHALDGGVSDLTAAMVVKDDVLYVGGSLLLADGKPSCHVGVWDFKPRR